MYFPPAFLSACTRRLPRGFGVVHVYPTPKTICNVSYRLALATLRVPSLVSLLIFVTIYIATEVVLAAISVPIFSGWHPAFPLSWRFLLVLLFVVPIFAFTQVFRLLLPLLIDRNRASGLGSVSLSRRGHVTLRRTVEPFDAAEEQHALLENAEEGNELSSRSSSPTASLAGPHHKQWWIQLLTYILLFIVSTWVGVHYEQPGDVRYRDSIQSAVAHPRRQGYGKQGKLLESVKLIPSLHW